MRPTFKWRGNSENQSGQAEYGIGMNLETLDMPTFLDANIIHSLLQQAYDAGAADANNAARRRLKALLEQLA